MKLRTLVTCWITILFLVSTAQRAAAGGYLAMIDFGGISYSTLPTVDDRTSSAISTGTSRFRFGSTTPSSVYVSTNGYLSVSLQRSYTDPVIPGDTYIISPYGADIDLRIAGTVRYSNGFLSYHSQMSSVSSFIRSETGNSFYGNSMMVAEWDGVAKLSGSFFTTSTFQAVLITDGSASYAVFIYDCGGMEWGGATIGWARTGTAYADHPLSGSSSASIGCKYSTISSAIIFRLETNFCLYSSEIECDNGNCEYTYDRCDGYDDCGDNSDERDCSTTSTTPTTTSPTTCPGYQFTCNNGDCEPESYVCDGTDDCGDNSDEEQNCVYTSSTSSYYCDSYDFSCDNGDCVYSDYECDNYDDCGDNSDEENCVNVGLAVGLSVGLFFLLCVCGIPLCIIIVVCLINRRSRRRPVLQTRVVATMPYAGATVVNQTQGTSFTAPYPAQPSQAPYYPTQAGYSNRAPYPAQNIQGGYPTPAPYPAQAPYPTQAPYPAQAHYPTQPPPAPYPANPAQAGYNSPQQQSEPPPPSYDAATAFPTTAQAAQVAAYPPASAPYPPEAQSNTGHSTSDPYQPQANPTLPQGAAQNPNPVPDDFAESAGFLLQP